MLSKVFVRTIEIHVAVARTCETIVVRFVPVAVGSVRQVPIGAADYLDSPFQVTCIAAR